MLCTAHVSVSIFSQAPISHHACRGSDAPAYMSMNRGGFLETCHVEEGGWVFHYECQNGAFHFAWGFIWKKKQA